MPGVLILQGFKRKLALDICLSNADRNALKVTEVLRFSITYSLLQQ